MRYYTKKEIALICKEQGKPTKEQHMGMVLAPSYEAASNLPTYYHDVYFGLIDLLVECGKIDAAYFSKEDTESSIYDSFRFTINFGPNNIDIAKYPWLNELTEMLTRIQLYRYFSKELRYRVTIFVYDKSDTTITFSSIGEISLQRIDSDLVTIPRGNKSFEFIFDYSAISENTLYSNRMVSQLLLYDPDIHRRDIIQNDFILNDEMLVITKAYGLDDVPIGMKYSFIHDFDIIESWKKAETKEREDEKAFMSLIQTCYTPGLIKLQEPDNTDDLMQYKYMGTNMLFRPPLTITLPKSIYSNKDNLNILEASKMRIEKRERDRIINGFRHNCYIYDILYYKNLNDGDGCSIILMDRCVISNIYPVQGVIELSHINVYQSDSITRVGIELLNCSSFQVTTFTDFLNKDVTSKEE